MGNNSPDRSVERRNAEDVPPRAHPAPQRCVPIHLAFFRGLNEDEGEGDDEGNPIAAKKIGDFHLS